ncbi:hypothetical protein [Saccharopolyspora mangrovi]|uniref:Uncharacterized protein n=1 Tax=Saccharopolyspora mangrovi TaxID=3082379 RepID=A0ABU6A874_9PSEU|nr:hypothetical protein [Saccharopolyspora sp. S2-29]MEB3367764.1 hypothetical protein [Saccharopolyspora sp. S2-29]
MRKQMLERGGKWVDLRGSPGSGLNLVGVRHADAASPVAWGLMAESNRWLRTARGPLVRFIAVLTVVAGFALMHAPQCADGMTPTVHLAFSGDALNAMVGVVHPDGSGHRDPGAFMPGAAADAATDDGAADHSMLMTCMALLVTLLGTLVLLRRSLIPLGTRIRMRCGPRARPRTPLRPSLIELCILRT